MPSYQADHLLKIGPWGLRTQTIGNLHGIRGILESTAILCLLSQHVRESLEASS